MTVVVIAHGRIVNARESALPNLCWSYMIANKEDPIASLTAKIL